MSWRGRCRRGRLGFAPVGRWRARRPTVGFDVKFEGRILPRRPAWLHRDSGLYQQRPVTMSSAWLSSLAKMRVLLSGVSRRCWPVAIASAWVAAKANHGAPDGRSDASMPSPPRSGLRAHHRTLMLRGKLTERPKHRTLPSLSRISFELRQRIRVQDGQAYPDDISQLSYDRPS